MWLLLTIITYYIDNVLLYEKFNPANWIEFNSALLFVRPTGSFSMEKQVWQAQ